MALTPLTIRPFQFLPPLEPLLFGHNFYNPFLFLLHPSPFLRQPQRTPTGQTLLDSIRTGLHSSYFRVVQHFEDPTTLPEIYQCRPHHSYLLVLFSSSRFFKVTFGRATEDPDCSPPPFRAVRAHPRSAELLFFGYLALRTQAGVCLPGHRSAHRHFRPPREVLATTCPLPSFTSFKLASPPDR